ncbi:Acyl-CoA synthetase (NDP forming) [Nonomuraea maritima]|uniref:Acyl-CoA synthetase (NDP forming) n=1 Tax=Nonomuraea maritima TaxID=683260 RepID=A0A1G8S592_9ACTN|nr:acetate--CoA ligase family protein [Nonomuraea maritima]SDJ24332.1 Acyl-CoA synthetase (NDP forming) [Nonomuraea maritima]
MKAFSDPASVAVVGASADPAKWGYWLARGALRGAHRRKVHLVNRSGAVIDGIATVPRLRDLPEPPELAVLCVPAATVPEVVEEALDLGVRAFVCITAGLDPARETALAGRIRAAGARLIGPNCLGVYDSMTALELAWGNFTPGALGIVSQSGQLGLELAGLAGEAEVGVSRFVSVGNQADVTAADVLADLAGHDRTEVVVLYLESFQDGRALVDTLAGLRERGKPVIVLTVGASAAGQAAARSHTGALTAGTEVVRAACRAAGAVLVETPAQAVDVAQLLLDAPAPVGRRIAVVGDSGGQGAVAADVLSRNGLELPELGAVASRVAALLPPGAGVRNPIDLAGAGERDLSTYSTLVDLLLESGEVDGVVLTGYFGSYGADAPSLEPAELAVVDAVGAVAARHGRPVIVHSMSRDSVAVRALREHGIPTYATIDQVGWSLGLATELAVTRPRATDHVPAAPGEERAALDYLAARAVLAGCGVRYPAAAAVSGLDDVRAAAGRLRPPYVLKAAWLAHKTESGGVVTGLDGPEAAATALADLIGRLGAGAYVLEEMDTRPGTVELIVGGRRDPSFGPLVLVGAGGTASELYRDVAVELAPVTVEVAGEMLRRLAAYPLLTGWRGAPATDVRAVAEVVAAVSELIAGRPDMAECEVNPLLAGPDGVVGVDALVVPR